MKSIKKILRALGLVILMLLALSGIGFIGAIFNTRERYRDREIKIEILDTKNNEEEAENSDQVQVKN